MTGNKVQLTFAELTIFVEISSFITSTLAEFPAAFVALVRLLLPVHHAAVPVQVAAISKVLSALVAVKGLASVQGPDVAHYSFTTVKRLGAMIARPSTIKTVAVVILHLAQATISATTISITSLSNGTSFKSNNYTYYSWDSWGRSS